MKRTKGYCDGCLRKRSIQKNGKCRGCNRQQGLQECSRCQTIRLISLDFYNDGRDGICKYCLGYKGVGGGRYARMMPSERALILELFGQKIPGIQIAKRIGCTRAMISKVIRQAAKEKGTFQCRRCLREVDASVYRHRLCSECLTLTPEQKREDSSLRKNYGLGFREFLKIADSQGNVCRICLGPSNRLVIDHDHAGAIRGLLCDSCSVGLGCFRGSTTFLRRAALYLSRAGEPVPEPSAEGCGELDSRPPQESSEEAED